MALPVYSPPTASPFPIPTGVTQLPVSQLPYLSPGFQVPPMGSVAGVGGQVPTGATLGAEVAAGAEGAGAATGFGAKLGSLLGKTGRFATNPIVAIPAGGYALASWLEPMDDPNIPLPTSTKDLIAQVEKYKQMGEQGGDAWWAKGMSKSIAQSPVDQVLVAAHEQGVDPAPLLQPLLAQLKQGKKPEELAPIATELIDKYLPAAVQQRDQQAAQTEQNRLAREQADIQHTSDQQFALALQAQATQFMEPYIQQIVQGGDMEANQYMQLASQVSPNLRGPFEAQAASARSGAMRMAGAYAAQAAMAPAMYMQGLAAKQGAAQDAELDRQYKQAQILQAQAYAQAALQGGSGGGTPNFGETVDSLNK